MRALRAALAAVLFLALGAQGGLGQGLPALTTLRLASSPDDDVTPVLYAQQAGLFARAGLNVDLSRMNNGAAVTAAVAGGSIDIGKSSLVPLLAAHVHGLPFTLVAPAGVWSTSAPVTATLVLKNSSIASARDLAGKTVSASSLKDLMAMSTQIWIDQHGGDSSAIRFVELPSPAVLTALAEGRVDAATVTNPNLAQALASGKVRVLSHPEDAIAGRFLLAAWFANDTFIAKNRGVVERFVAVLREAVRYTNAHHAETVPLVAAFTGIDPATVATMTRATGTATLDPREIRPVIEVAVKYKIIDRAFDPQEFLLSPGNPAP
jgi:NitT/TauT family transport system substrate-binding protein